MARLEAYLKGTSARQLPNLHSARSQAASHQCSRVSLARDVLDWMGSVVSHRLALQCSIICHVKSSQIRKVEAKVDHHWQQTNLSRWRGFGASTRFLVVPRLQTEVFLQNSAYKSSRNSNQTQKCRASFSWRFDDDAEEDCDENGVCTPAELKNFEDGRSLFNQQEFYKCHDVLENLWHTSPEPQRSVLHGILQCAVGLYHLQNQNHRGALIQFGEGLNKLRRQRLRDGSLHEFEQDMSALLEFVYSTQLEHAACDDDACVPMAGDDESYRLLGDFGAGQPMYQIHEGPDGCKYVHFCTARQEKLLSQGFEQQRVLLPILRVSEADLLNLGER